MSIYPEILKRVITNNLNITFSTNTPSSCGLFESLIETPVEFRDWKTIYDATRHMDRNESIVYILLCAYLPKMIQEFADNNDIKTHCIAKFRIIDELFSSSYDGKPPLSAITYENESSSVVPRSSTFLRPAGVLTHPRTSAFSIAYLCKPIRQHILSILQKTQRTYHAFSKIARVYRHKHTPVQINTDLYMNDLTLSNPTTFVLLDHDKVYYFSLNDLAKIMIDSLTYSYMFFIEPKVCKNPYNNVPFTKSALYNIYFRMKSVFCVVPPLIHAFFMSDFNVFLFKKQNESAILEHIIREYVAKTDPIHMRAEILKMIREYDTENVLTIHPLVPSKSLVKGLKPMLLLYLSRKHTQDGYLYQNYGFELSCRMNRFVKQNPQFGHMIFKPKLPVFAIERSSVANVPLTNAPPTNASGHVFVFGENRSSTTNTTDTANSPSFTFSNPTAFPYSSFMQMQMTRFVLHHTNTELNPGYNDTVVYKRSPDRLLDFLENHQYNEPAYNRYLYSGSIYSVDEPQPLAPSIPDTDSSTESDATEPGQYQDNESGDEYVIRVYPQEGENDANESVETHAIVALRQLQNEPSLSLPLSPLRITEGWAEEDADNDNNTVSTEEERLEQMARENEYIIAGDNSSDMLSVASSIDYDGEYDDTDGYDSVS